jgi:protein SCO1/2
MMSGARGQGPGAGVVAVVAVLLAGCTAPKPLPVLGQVPPFQLTAQTGQPFSSQSLDGHIWVADFIYTTCTGPCPMMS